MNIPKNHQHVLTLTFDQVVNLAVALDQRVAPWAGQKVHPDSSIGATRDLVERVRHIMHGNKSYGAFALDGSARHALLGSTGSQEEPIRLHEISK